MLQLLKQQQQHFILVLLYQALCCYNSIFYFHLDCVFLLDLQDSEVTGAVIGRAVDEASQLPE